MVKITSFRWAEKDDPMFTGRFHIHSVKKQEFKRNKKQKNKSEIIKNKNNKNEIIKILSS